MNHQCRTGFHDVPHEGCYARHGCRCDGCTKLKVASNRAYRTAGHDCPSGYHQGPSSSCYQHHGCRCQGCKRAKAEAFAPGEHLDTDHPALSTVTVELPRRPWELIVRELHRRGVTADEWLHTLARKVSA